MRRCHIRGALVKDLCSTLLSKTAKWPALLGIARKRETTESGRMLVHPPSGFSEVREAMQQSTFADYESDESSDSHWADHETEASA